MCPLEGQKKVTEVSQGFAQLCLQSSSRVIAQETITIQTHVWLLQAEGQQPLQVAGEGGNLDAGERAL